MKETRMKETSKRLKPATLAVRGWVEGGRRHRPLDVPLYLSSVWEATTPAELGELFGRRPDEGFYTRFGHPTLREAERKLAELEGAEDALLFGSGMGAIACTLLALLRRGDHAVAQRAMFAQTFQLFKKLQEDMGVEVDFVDPTQIGEVERHLRDSTRLVYIETPSNPLIEIVDMRAVAAAVKPTRAILVVDGTFAGPMLQRPLDLGAAVSVQSASKSLGGHADLLAGVAAGSAEVIARIRTARVLLGPVLDPHACWLLLRGLKTLSLRVERQSQNALAIARVLASDARVGRVRHAFLPGTPGYEVARSQMLAGGSMVSFEMAAGHEAAVAFVSGLEWIAVASSLGHVATTIEVPSELDFSEEELGKEASQTGISPGLIRLSVGIEDPDDLKAEMQRGLAAVATYPAASTA